MKILKQSPFFFSIIGILVLLYVSRGTLLPEDFEWPVVKGIQAQVLESIPLEEVDTVRVELQDWPRAESNSDIDDCSFHIYDKSGNIHCSSTYDGHLGNIKRYLK